MPENQLVASKPGLHERNLHRHGYHFEELIQSCPELSDYVCMNKYNTRTIDFSDSKAVKLFNFALLKHYYAINTWDIPENYLCPPVPGRADYIHNIRDLIGDTGQKMRILDIGTGANCIFPILGHRIYDWSFVATDIDPRSIKNANEIINANPGLADAIELRLQKDSAHIFKDVTGEKEYFDASMCNPPFHSSLEEAAKGNLRKWKSLGKELKNKLNFGGQRAELWCEGGEIGFISQMIFESSLIPGRCKWFTVLVSKESNLPLIHKKLTGGKAKEVRVMEMAQGQKRSRIVAWTFSNC